MTLSDKQIAAILVKANAPKLRTKDIAEYVGVKDVTLRSWPTKKYINLIDTERGSSGRGKSSLFSPLDVAQLMACANMTRFSIIPGFLTAELSSEVTAVVLDYLHIIAETDGYTEDIKKRTAKYYDRMIAQAKNRSNSKEVVSAWEKSKREALEKAEPQRFLSVTFSPLLKVFMPVPVGEGETIVSGGAYSESVHLVFDCLDIADKLIKAYRIYAAL